MSEEEILEDEYNFDPYVCLELIRSKRMCNDDAEMNDIESEIHDMFVLGPLRAEKTKKYLMNKILLLKDVIIICSDAHKVCSRYKVPNNIFFSYQLLELSLINRDIARGMYINGPFRCPTCYEKHRNEPKLVSAMIYMDNKEADEFRSLIPISSRMN